MAQKRARWSALECYQSGVWLLQMVMAQQRITTQALHQWEFPEWAQEELHRANFKVHTAERLVVERQKIGQGGYFIGTGRWRHTMSLQDVQHLPEVRWRGLHHDPGNIHLQAANNIAGTERKKAIPWHIGGSVSSNHKSSNRIELHWWGQDLFDFSYMTWPHQSTHPFTKP